MLKDATEYGKKDDDKIMDVMLQSRDQEIIFNGKEHDEDEDEIVSEKRAPKEAASKKVDEGP